MSTSVIMIVVLLINAAALVVLGIEINRLQKVNDELKWKNIVLERKLAGKGMEIFCPYCNMLNMIDEGPHCVHCSKYLLVDPQ